MQSVVKHLASGNESIVQQCGQDASSLLDAQNALHDGLLEWALIDWPLGHAVFRGALGHQPGKDWREKGRKGVGGVLGTGFGIGPPEEPDRRANPETPLSLCYTPGE